MNTAIDPHRDMLASEVLEAEFFKTIGYSTVWEDEQVITDGLAPQPGDRVFSITSGACFSLQFLRYDVQEVISLDCNPIQTSLLEYKMASARALTYREIWEVLGLVPSQRRPQLHESLACYLSRYAFEYFERHPKVIERGVSLSGKQDRYLHGLGRCIRLLQGERKVDRLLSCTTIPEQRHFYDEEWNSFRWRRFCDIVFSRTVLDRAFDKKHFKYSQDNQPALRFRRAIEHVLRNVVAAENFYLYYLLNKTYRSHEQCPAWLRRSTFSQVRSRLDRLQPVTEQLEHFIFSQPDNTFDCFNFSNIFDWVSQKVFIYLMREVVRTARPGARLCYCTNLANTKHVIDPERLPEIKENKDLSRQISWSSRTPGYSGCVVATIEK